MARSRWERSEAVVVLKRESWALSNGIAAGSDAIVLACVLLAALVLTSIGVGRMMRSRTMRDLQPSLIG